MSKYRSADEFIDAVKRVTPPLKHVYDEDEERRKGHKQFDVYAEGRALKFAIEALDAVDIRMQGMMLRGGGFGGFCFFASRAEGIKIMKAMQSIAAKHALAVFWSPKDPFRATIGSRLISSNDDEEDYLP